jgi:aspartate dehydrogenase
MRKLKIGIVGCGAIGSKIAEAIVNDFKEKATLSAIYDIKLETAFALSSRLKNKKLAVLSLEDLIKKCKFVVEAASASVSYNITKKAIEAKRDILVMSVGGIVEESDLFQLAAENNCNIYIPTGAIAGIDAIKATKIGKIKKVQLTTRKPPQSLKGAPFILKNNINLDEIKEPTLIFEGSARSAVVSFPQNINVAATLSLAGIGLDETKVKIITSPDYTRNSHEIEIEAESGIIRTYVENMPCPDNPKTSYLAVLSAIATLKQILGPVKLGT